MHFSPYHKKRSWQIFSVGVICGAIIAYVIFTFMNGKMVENKLLENIQLQTKVDELERQNYVLQQDKKHLQAESKYAVETIDIEYVNSEQLKLDRLITHQFDVLLKEELNEIIGNEVENIANVNQLFISLIENKQYTIDDLTYEFEVQKLFVSETLKLLLYVKLVK